MVTLPLKFMIFGPAFCRDYIGYLLQQLRVKSGGHADRLRKYRGNARPRYAVQSLAPPVIVRQVKPFNRTGAVHHLGDFFF